MSLEKLINIPKELKSNPNLSFYNLVKEYYFDDFSELLVYDYLIKNHSIHNNWLLFCEDKRVEEEKSRKSLLEFEELCSELSKDERVVGIAIAKQDIKDTTLNDLIEIKKTLQNSFYFVNFLHKPLVVV